MKNVSIGILIGCIFLVLGFGAGYLFTHNTPQIPPILTLSPTPVIIRLGISPTSTQLANPASQNCASKGGTLSIKKRADGGEYGLCMFEDNMACEEWALFRGQCPVGGIKTTGYDTDAERYCAWIGGKTFAVKDATCTLPNKKVCNDEALFNGTCTP